MENIVPVVLSGGAGTRLWPQSRESMPKQFVNLIGEHTLFESTLARMTKMGLSSGIVVANEEHRFIVAEQLRTTSNEGFKIVLEPFGRNTAPAIAMAALQAQSDNPNSILFVAPADHLLEVNEELEGFHELLNSFPSHLQSFPHKQEYLQKLIKPAFSENRVLLWKR